MDRLAENMKATAAHLGLPIRNSSTIREKYNKIIGTG